jgi:hypothetical protein
VAGLEAAKRLATGAGGTPRPWVPERIVFDGASSAAPGQAFADKSTPLALELQGPDLNRELLRRVCVPPLHLEAVYYPFLSVLARASGMEGPQHLPSEQTDSESAGMGK